MGVWQVDEIIFFNQTLLTTDVIALKHQTPSQSEIFSVIVTFSYVLAFQDQTPSQSEIFSVIVDCSICIGLLGWHTLPKWNILCYCSLFICIDLSRPQHPPKVKFFFFSKLLLEVQYFLKYFFKAVTVPWSLLVCMYWPFNTSTPSQSEIFFQIFFVIVFIWCPIFSKILF